MEELALSKRKCPLYFRRDNNREIRENRESVYGLFFLVRAVRVVRGLGFSNGVSAIIHNNFNRETRENCEQKRECPQEASPPLSESSAERDLP